MNSRVYNILKHVALYVLPASSALYVTLGNIWHLPDVEAVVGTIAAVNTFLGASLQISSAKYTPPADAHLVVDDSDPEKTKMEMEFITHPDEMVKKPFATVKVVHPLQDTTAAPPRSI